MRHQVLQDRLWRTLRNILIAPPHVHLHRLAPVPRRIRASVHVRSSVQSRQASLTGVQRAFAWREAGEPPILKHTHPNESLVRTCEANELVLLRRKWPLVYLLVREAVVGLMLPQVVSVKEIHYHTPPTASMLSAEEEARSLLERVCRSHCWRRGCETGLQGRAFQECQSVLSTVLPNRGEI